MRINLSLSLITVVFTVVFNVAFAECLASIKFDKPKQYEIFLFEVSLLISIGYADFLSLLPVKETKTVANLGFVGIQTVFQMTSCGSILYK